MLNSMNNSDRLDHFYRLWSLKECFLKMDGRGLYHPLDNNVFGVYNDTIRFHYNKLLYDKVMFISEKIDKDHGRALCTNMGSVIEDIELIDADKRFITYIDHLCFGMSCLERQYKNANTKRTITATITLSQQFRTIISRKEEKNDYKRK